MKHRPIAVLNEHPDWQKRLYAELSRRGVAYEDVPIHDTLFDPRARAAAYGLVLNRVSPSSAKRGHASAVFFAQHVLGYYEDLGVPVVNGRGAYLLETSKALQVLLLEKLGLRYPRTLVANSPAAVRRAAEALSFPLMVKPNIGGSGAGIQKFDTRDALDAWLSGEPPFGIDGTVLVQEFHPAEGGYIVRVEMLGTRHLYSVRIYPDATDFNLCPADICQVERAGEAAKGAAPAPGAGGGDFALCVMEAPVKGLQMERHEEAPEVIEAARRVATAGGLDVCGIEYLVSGRDGQRYFYDVNALSNFVRDAEALVGVDPTKVFVDDLVERLRA